MAELGPSVLRAFVEVAEQLHFGRAARALYLTTPALSQQISRLEKTLGTPLFDRSSRRVELTAAGQQLLPLARDAVAAHDRIATWTKRRATPSLRIAFMHAGPHPLTGNIIAAIFQRFAGAHLDFKHMHREDVPEALRSAEIDAAFLWGPHGFDGIRTEVLAHEPRVVLLNTSSALVECPDVSIDDLQDQPVLVPDSADPAYLAWCTVDPRPDGSRPEHGRRAHSLEEVLALVAAGYGVYFLPRCVARGVNHPDVVQREVRDLPSTPFSVSIADRGSSVLANQLLELAVATTGTADRAVTSPAPQPDCPADP